MNLVRCNSLERSDHAVGLVPYSLETGYGLSPQAEAKVGALVDRAPAILAGWGVVHA